MNAIFKSISWSTSSELNLMFNPKEYSR